jgi:tRNA A37 threonylcarbamoyladenosine synthetase subunit TsaC/SUA5/YrdC
MLPVILTQTDTTVGFLSQDANKLYEIKSRERTKPFIKVYQDFQGFLSENNRVPHPFKSQIRRAKKTTFIVKNRAFRIAHPPLHSQILRNSSWYFSSSANEASKKFQREFCENKADIIIEDIHRLQENNPSALIILNNVKRKKIR